MILAYSTAMSNKRGNIMKIGKKFPNFKLDATQGLDPSKAFTTLSQDSFPNQWKIYFFWPKDFTFVCPTELKAFNDLIDEFADRDTVIIGGSIDSEFVHLAWRNNHKDLKDLKYPMLSDIKRELAQDLNILDESGVMQRATYIVDPQNIIRFSMITDMNVGRNPQEVLRVLDALQTDELCPCNWNPGEATLKVGIA